MLTAGVLRYAVAYAKSSDCCRYQQEMHTHLCADTMARAVRCTCTELQVRADTSTLYLLASLCLDR